EFRHASIPHRVTGQTGKPRHRPSAIRHDHLLAPACGCEVLTQSSLQLGYGCGCHDDHYRTCDYYSQVRPRPVVAPGAAGQILLMRPADLGWARPDDLGWAPGSDPT